MGTCNKRGCENVTDGSRYCSYRCEQAAAHVEQRNRSRIVNGRRRGGWL